MDDSAKLSGGGFAFGSMSAARPDSAGLNRSRFRIALMGDFSGRAAKGELETGSALAKRRAIKLDMDTVEAVIEGFATKLVLPIGNDGAGIEVELNELDDLHPDELFEKVELFEALSDLKSRASSSSAADELKAWGEEFGRPVRPPHRKSAGNSVPADMKLSDFQKLVGGAVKPKREASDVDALLARVVGPHIVKAPDANAQAMEAAVDDALSGAMRLVLHHPDFQSVEAQWRSLDLIARTVETDNNLDIVLYDISAEEIAADLAAADDLSESGLYELLGEGTADGRGNFSALVGLYTFEETPPHAELLGRIARLAAHIDAPFFSAIAPECLDTPMDERHPLVADAWDTLRAMPEAGHIGLATPRFMLRRPYGAKSDPIYEFEFEEFTMQEGLKGLLWANPAVLITILLGRSFKTNGAAMKLGSLMSQGEIPFHYITDQYGDQVALPCTARNLSEANAAKVVQRGLMPVVSIKGRDEIRLASFQSLTGETILGPWSGVAPPPPSPASVDTNTAADEASDEPVDEDEAELDSLLADLDLGGDDDDGDDSADADADDSDDGDLDLDALLASFGDDDDSDDDDDDDDMDAELAALLEGL